MWVVCCSKKYTGKLYVVTKVWELCVQTVQSNLFMTFSLTLQSEVVCSRNLQSLTHTKRCTPPPKIVNNFNLFFWLVVFGLWVCFFVLFFKSRWFWLIGFVLAFIVCVFCLFVVWEDFDCFAKIKGRLWYIVCSTF